MKRSAARVTRAPDTLKLRESRAGAVPGDARAPHAGPDFQDIARPIRGRHTIASRRSLLETETAATLEDPTRAKHHARTTDSRARTRRADSWRPRWGRSRRCPRTP